jgi:hypothetical protein
LETKYPNEQQYNGNKLPKWVVGPLRGASRSKNLSKLSKNSFLLMEEELSDDFDF